MIQIDMPMPTNCATCRIQHYIGCNIAKDNGMNSKERDVRCPLKELIQCKDCKRYYANGGNCDQVLAEWFCADGERRDDNA